MRKTPGISLTSFVINRMFTADWSIVNSIENSCNMQVTITGEDGTVLYESRTLEPGEQELTGELKTELEPGSYTAEAEARAIDRIAERSSEM